VPEHKQFLGLVFVTGIIEKSDLKMYWTGDPVFGNPEFFKNYVQEPFRKYNVIVTFQ
jgi:hypothetical protein